MYPWMWRFVATYKIFTKRNFIIVFVNEFDRDGQTGRSIQELYRTDYSDESDALTLLGAYQRTMKKNHKLNF
jgi:hypothetical protein